MNLEPDHIELLVAAAGAANAVWALVLTFVTTRKAEADMRRITKNLAVSFGDIAAELVRGRDSSRQKTT